MSRFAILLGGDVTATARLRRQLEGARVIAADSGIAHAHNLALRPELWLGDFDSAGSELAIVYRDVPRQVFPAAKSETDGAIAIAEALRLGATELILVGGLGGQFDHVLSHATQLLALEKAGISAFCTSGTEQAYPLLRAKNVPGLPHGTRISIVGLADLSALSISGVRWPLDRRDVPLGSTITLSNETAGDVAITLEGGAAIVVAYPPEDGLT